MGDKTAEWTVERLGTLIAPDPDVPEEAGGIINPAAARGRDRHLYLFPRIVAKDKMSRIGIARVLFDDAGQPRGVERIGYALEPRAPYELADGHYLDVPGGCEDPRIVYLEPLNLYLMTYVAVGPQGARVAVAVSKTLLSWERLGLVDFEPIPDPVYGVNFDGYNNKDAMFFPKAVPGPDGHPSLAMLHRPMYGKEDRPRDVYDVRHGTWMSYCRLDDARRDLHALRCLRHHHLLAEPEYGWEEQWIGGGAPPLRLPSGWLLIYHGVRRRAPRYPGERKPVVYSAGVMLLDGDNPRHVLYRSPEPVLKPEIKDEMEGLQPEAVFPTGLDGRDDGSIDIYYGMADTRLGVARLHRRKDVQ